jgi:hypothetical protein
MQADDDFEARLPPSARKALESKLTEEGVLPSLYVPPERWSETRSADELRWEQKVQAEARRGGNQLRQNELLQQELGM